MLERILVPLDGSHQAEAILFELAGELRREESEVILFRSVYLPLSYDPEDEKASISWERTKARRYLQKVSQRFALQGAKVRARVSEGPPAKAILTAAGEEGATVIAMASHGRKGFARWVLGSVSEEVVRFSEIPVLLTRCGRRTTTPPP